MPHLFYENETVYLVLNVNLCIYWSVCFVINVNSIFYRSVHLALYEPIISASRVEDSKQRLIEIRNVLHKLPRHNFETLGYLCKHLHRIVLHEEINKVTCFLNICTI